MTPNSDPIQRHASEVPGDIRRAVGGLAGDQQLGTIVYLLKERRQSFAELQEELDIHQQTLTNTLSKLQEGGLVVRKDTQDDDSNYSTRYEVTEFGKRVMDKLFDAIQPQNTLRTLPVAETSCWIEDITEDDIYVVNSAQRRSSGQSIFIDSLETDRYKEEPQPGVEGVV